MLTEQQRAATLERFAQHRRAWDSNPALRALYGQWYGKVAESLPPEGVGPRLELGSGPGFAREFIPGMELSDLVKAPWHDREMSAEDLPLGDASLGALVLFDVLHHLPSPVRFFQEATRVLRPGGRVILCEPYIGPLSYPVYKFLHEEPVEMRVDPLAASDASGVDKDPFDSNQAIPTLLFLQRRAAFDEHLRPLGLRVTHLEHLAGPSYPASGGFSRGPLLPGPLWRGLWKLEERLPPWLFRVIGFRLLAVIEKG